MAAERDRCFDELVIAQGKLEDLHAALEKNSNNEETIKDARALIERTSIYIESNKSSIPPYTLKKALEVLARLETQVNKVNTSKLQFKFKKSEPKSTPESIKPKAEPKSEYTVLPRPEAIFGLHDLSDEELELLDDKVEGKDVSLLRLNRCNVKVKGCASTLYIRDLEDCTVLVCLASRAITVANCKSCRFTLVCQQLRIDSTASSDFEVFTSTRSMMEASDKLTFRMLNIAHLNETLGDTANLFENAKFDTSKNNWRCIDDFDWVSPIPSPNYRVLDDNESDK